MSDVVRLPRVVATLLRPLPLWPLERALQHLVSGISARHPALPERLACGAARRCAIDPVDLPIAIVITPCDGRIAVRVTRDLAPEDSDARIAGPLTALVGLVNGAYDGDALFFSRDITVEGDIETVLALRNAIDDAEIDLLSEALAPAGIVGRALAGAVRGFDAACRSNTAHHDAPSQGLSP